MTQFDNFILEDIWKWKFLTTAALDELHFRNLSPAYAHRRLLDLKLAGLAKWLPLPGKHGRDFAWTLTKKGFDAIQPLPFPLKEKGFRSESIEHDWMVTAIHLGEWLLGFPEGCDVFTEQELRRNYVDGYPAWVPKTEIRRPDGYWRAIVKGEPQTVALEVEMSGKLDSEYPAVAQFYSADRDLFRVVWLVKHEGLAKRLLEAIGQVGGKGSRLHNFVLLKDFLKSGWNCQFFAGRDVGVPLAKLLLPTSATPRPHVGSTLLLNALKSPHRSPDYAKLRESLKSHRVGISLLAPPPSSTPSTPSTKGDPTNET